MKTLTPLILISFFLFSARAQNDQTSQIIFPRHIDRDEAKQLIEILKSAPDIWLNFENIARSPLLITEAKVKIAKRERSRQSSLVSAQDSYVMEEKVGLVNNSDKRTSWVKLRFRDHAEQKEFEVSAWTSIDPYGSYIFGKDKADFQYESLPIDPSKFTVNVFEVQFEDGTIWEMFPSYTEEVKVDTKPVPLSKPQPAYTEEAKRNRTQGPVRMRVLIGINGEVKHIRVISGLPDGLNEEAIRETSNLKFKPAMINGQPVEYWIPFIINFFLPLRSN